MFNFSIIGRVRELFPVSCHERLFLVGGGARDALMGNDSRDLDLVGVLAPKEFISLGFRLVEPASGFPIWFRTDPFFEKIEVTAVDSVESLEKDLQRRDFTVNAFAITMQGEIIDPLKGYADLEAKVLRACSDMIFVEDPVRIFRAFRFEADGWRLHHDTEGLIQGRDWSQLLAQVPIERFSREMVKGLAMKDPARFFRLMLAFGVGKNFLPELFSMAEVPAGPFEHHPERDLFTHSLQVLERVAILDPDPMARFCALFHDLGKLATEPGSYPRHQGHEDAGARLALGFCDRLRLPAAYRRSLNMVCRFHGKANRWGELRDATRIGMAVNALKAGVAGIIPLIAAADKPAGSVMPGWVEAVAVAGESATQLGVDRPLIESEEPRRRSAFIMQRRLDKFRKMMTPIAGE